MKGKIIKFVAFASCIGICTSMALAWGELTTLRVIQTQTMLIRHKATEEQRRAAERNKYKAFREITAAMKAQLVKKNVHSVLIKTVRSEHTSKKAVDVRLRYSLEGEVLIDDYAYESPAPLEAGTILKTNGVELNYVGL